MPRQIPKFELPAELTGRINTLQSDLDAVAGEMLNRFQRQPARWRQSDAGNDVLAWLENIAHLAEALENLDTKVDAADHPNE